MGIKPRTYYEAFCDAPEHADIYPIEFGEYTAFRDADQVETEIQDRDGVVTADGRVFCSWECKPDDVCTGYDDNVHRVVDGECACGYAAPAAGGETTG